MKRLLYSLLLVPTLLCGQKNHLNNLGERIRQQVREELTETLSSEVVPTTTTTQSVTVVTETSKEPSDSKGKPAAKPSEGTPKDKTSLKTPDRKAGPHETELAVPTAADNNVTLADTIENIVYEISEGLAIPVSFSSGTDTSDGKFIQSRVIITVVAIAVPCLVIFLIVLAIIIANYKKSRNRTRIIEQAIEKSYELPESFFTGAPSTNHDNVGERFRSNDTPEDTRRHQERPRYKRVDEEVLFRNGMSLIAVGVAIVIFFYLSGATPICALGLIPLIIGVGKIVTYYNLKDERDNR